MTKTVTISALRANGTPYAHHDVIVTLVAGSAGGVVGSNVVVESQTVKLDANGAGSVPLYTNDVEITSPSTSFYRFTVKDSSPTITRSIRLTDDLPSSVSWTLADIQVGDPTTPQRDVSAAYVQVGDQSLRNYLADLETGGGGSSDNVTVPDGTMTFIEAYYPPASDDLTANLDSIDEAFVGAAQAIVAVGAASIGTSQRGAPNGVAELDGSGLVLSAQLPSYVDDVIVVADFAALPGTGADGKIYVTSDTNLSWRWTGSAYVEISKSLALGTTSSTAHRGDHGAAAYAHSQATGNPHGTTAANLGVLRPEGPAFFTADSNAAMTALTAVRGDVCYRPDLDGTTYVLTSSTPANLGDWQVQRYGQVAPIFPALMTAKGDLISRSGSGVAAVVPRGADGTVLAAHTAAPNGLEWIAPPWLDDFTVLHMVRDPYPFTGAAPTYVGEPARAGGYVYTSASGWVWTFARIPLRAGTYTRRFVRRTDAQAGIVVFTIGGIPAGSADGYSPVSASNVVDDAAGIVIPADGFYDLVMTSTTKNASSGNYRANAQFTRLFRTGDA